MKRIDITTADFDTLCDYILNLFDGVLSLGAVKPIVDGFKSRKDLTVDEKCKLLDMIGAYSKARIIENPKSINAILLEWSGKENSIPSYCEAQKEIVTAMARGDEQPGDPQQTAPNEQPGTPRAIDETILNILPCLYDLLVDEGVISDSLTKVDFISCISKGEVPSMSKDNPKSWVKVKRKFKHTIKKIRPFFDVNWYNAVCSSANLTPLQMRKYNTDELEAFSRKLQNIGLK